MHWGGGGLVVPRVKGMYGVIYDGYKRVYMVIRGYVEFRVQGPGLRILEFEVGAQMLTSGFKGYTGLYRDYVEIYKV